MDKLNLADVIEIKQIKYRLRKDEGLYNMFIMLLKIVNKTLNNDKINTEDEIYFSDTDTEKSLNLYDSDESD